MGDKILFIYQKGFRQISLPNKEIINITSCDGGCFITTERNLKEAEKLLNKYIGLPIYEIWCDTNRIITGSILEKAEIRKHAEYEIESDYIWIYDKNIMEDGKYVEV